MKLCCCTEIKYYDLLVASGYDAIALAGVDIVAWSEEELYAAVKKLQEGPLEHESINRFCEGSLRLHGLRMDLQAIEAYTRKLCQRAALLGFRYIGIGAPVSRNLEPGEHADAAMEEFVRALRLICNIAREYGLDILLESVCSMECNFLTTTWEAAALMEQIQISNLHLVYDIFHEQMEQQSLSVLHQYIDQIRTVHIAQLQKGARGYLQMEKLAEYMVYWEVLSSCGYEGDFSVEAFLGDPADGIRESALVLQQMRRSCPTSNRNRR